MNISPRTFGHHFIAAIIPFLGVIILKHTAQADTQPPCTGSCPAYPVECLTPEEFQTKCNGNPAAGSCVMGQPECKVYVKNGGNGSSFCGQTINPSSPPTPNLNPENSDSLQIAKDTCLMHFGIGADQSGCKLHCEQNKAGSAAQKACFQQISAQHCGNLEGATPERKKFCSEIGRLVCFYAGQESFSQCRCDIGAPDFGMPCAACVLPCADLIKSCLAGNSGAPASPKDEEWAIKQCANLSCYQCKTDNCEACSLPCKDCLLKPSPNVAGITCSHCPEPGAEVAQLRVTECSQEMTNGVCHSVCPSSTGTMLQSLDGTTFTSGGLPQSEADAWVVFGCADPTWHINGIPDEPSTGGPVVGAMCECEKRITHTCRSYTKQVKCPGDANWVTLVEIVTAPIEIKKMCAKPPNVSSPSSATPPPASKPKSSTAN